MNNAYINLKTGEIINPSSSDYINCDSEIAEIILLLNKKGYITKYSCTSHVENMLAYERKIPLDARYFLEANPELQVIREDSEGIIYRGFAYGSMDLYICFEKEYEFKNLPNGFEFKDNFIRRELSLIDENGNNKDYTIEELKKDKSDSIKDLYEWVKNLDYIN